MYVCMYVYNVYIYKGRRQFIPARKPRGNKHGTSRIGMQRRLTRIDTNQHGTPVDTDWHELARNAG